MDITLLYFESCPNWKKADALLTQLADELDLRISHRRVETIEDAELYEFRGSPTIQVNGTDPFARPEDPVGLACRIYTTPAGVLPIPTEEMLRAAIAR